MKTVADSRGDLSALKNDGRMHVYLSGNHFQQNTVQNALFGAMQITKNADTDKYKYKGYGICFNEGGLCSIGDINNGRNAIIKQITYLLWVMLLYKELTIRHCMQKKCTSETLLNLVQNLYLVFIIMVIIVIYLLMVNKN